MSERAECLTCGSIGDGIARISSDDWSAAFCPKCAQEIAALATEPVALTDEFKAAADIEANTPITVQPPALARRAGGEPRGVTGRRGQRRQAHRLP